ncbi:MAG TPA: hypothetical protein VHQ45_13455, partial [Gemmatimonadaceae bacterium]|nr:hypothetical protein [Gemmatimonadaceae bacterium]
GPGEIRVYARSWRVRRVTPDSRVDVSTGDLRTNVFRGFFGKRWRHGELLQVGGQQYSTTNPNNTDGDQLSVFVRGGLARDRWSVDGFALTTSRLRNAQVNFLDQPPLSPLDSRNLLYYLRAGIGDPSAGGAWAQVIASSQRFDERTEDPAESGGGATLPRDTVDTLVKRAQYVATGGYTSGPLRVSGALRLRTPESATLLSPSARAEWAQRLVAAAAFVERSAEDSTLRAEATVRVQPVPFVSLVGAASQAAPFDDHGERSTVNSLRVEAGVQVKDLWLSGGVLSRSSAPIRPPIVYDTALVGGTRQTTGAFARVTGRVWRDVSAAVVGTQWDEDATLLGYLPRQQVRSEITLDTRWLSRFPRGNFGLRASFAHEYRSQVVFPLVNESLVSPSHSLFSGLLEIHIEDAVLMLQVRNLSNVQYFSVPGYLMPPTTLIYGVRWQFWN